MMKKAPPVFRFLNLEMVLIRDSLLFNCVYAQKIPSQFPLQLFSEEKERGSKILNCRPMLVEFISTGKKMLG